MEYTLKNRAVKGITAKPQGISTSKTQFPMTAAEFEIMKVLDVLTNVMKVRASAGDSLKFYHSNSSARRGQVQALLAVLKRRVDRSGYKALVRLVDPVAFEATQKWGR